MEFYPRYLALLANGALKKKADMLMSQLEDCTICPHHCQVNRSGGQLGYCHAGSDAEISGYGPHFGEETPLVGKCGSGTLFFSHCNLGCVYCQNWDTSHNEGKKLSPRELADIMLKLQSQGCHNINLVSPSHYIPQIIAAVLEAAEQGLNIPLVYNSGGYDKITTLQNLNGLVDIYMPDFKYGDLSVGRRLSGVDDYTDITEKAIIEMHRQVGDLRMNRQGIARQGLLIRHLVLPGGLAGTERVMKFIADEISPYSYINIMDQYHPEFKASQYPGLDRRITSAEFQEAVLIAKRASPHFRFAHERES